MPSLKCKNAVIENVEPIDALVNYSIEGQRGLYLRVTPKLADGKGGGAKTWAMIYRSRITGKLVNEKIGSYPAISLKTACGLVQDAWKLVELAKPVTFSPAKKNEGTVNEILELYEQRKLTELRTGREIKTALASIIRDNKWGDLPFATLDKDQIMNALYHIRDGRKRKAPRYAGNVQQMMSSWMNWAVIHDKREFNPILIMPNVGGRPEPRERALSDDELRKVWAACHAPEDYGLDPVYADVMLLILTTACRPGMACGAVDGEFFGMPGRPAAERRGAGPVQDLPKERMKMGVPFVLPLNSLALEVVKRRLGNGFLFPTPSKSPKDKGKAVRVRRLSYITRELSERLGFKEHFTPHDLRRTASVLLNREFDPEREVTILLAHGIRGIMRHYTASMRWNPRQLELKRKLSDRLAELLKEITSVGEVVEIRRAV